MKIENPYPAELLRVAHKVVWYDVPERTLEDLPTFLAHLMVYGSQGDVELVHQYVSPEEFRKVLEKALRVCLRRMPGSSGTSNLD